MYYACMGCWDEYKFTTTFCNEPVQPLLFYAFDKIDIINRGRIWIIQLLKNMANWLL